MRHVLVVGQNGQLARALAAEGRRWAFALTHTSRAELDLRDPGLVAGFIASRRPAAVINASAYNAVDKAESESAVAMAVNGASVGELARACEALGVPFVHVSTDYVFDGRKGAPYIEYDAAFPLKAYGRSKLAGEILTLQNAERSAVVRTSWVHSALGAGFVQTIARAAALGRPIELVDDQFGRPTWAPDLAGAVLIVLGALLERDSRGSGIFHYSGAGDASRADWGAYVLERLAAERRNSATFCRVKSADFVSSAQRPRDTRLDCPRFIALAGENSLRDWREGVARTVRDLPDF